VRVQERVPPRVDAGTWTKACARCLRAHDARAWGALALVTTVSPANVQEHLSVEAGWGLEVRRCDCGALLATRASC
jgi:hypothetical protein